MEILVVLAIIALITGVVALSVMRHYETARVRTSRESARALRSAVALHRAHGGDDCPTVEVLLAAQEVDSASKTTDAWDRPFAIECDDQGGVTVASSGPDKRLGTEDDIRVPDPPAPIVRAR